MVKALVLESPVRYRFRIGFSRKGGPKDGAVVVYRGTYPTAKAARAKLAQVAERVRPATSRKRAYLVWKEPYSPYWERHDGQAK